MGHRVPDRLRAPAIEGRALDEPIDATVVRPGGAWRTRIVGGVCVSVVLAVGVWAFTPEGDDGASRSSSGASASSASSSATGAASERTSTTAPPLVPATVSFDDATAHASCTMLDAAAIEAAFAEPVGAPQPLWPACHWPVGTDAFLALAFDANRPWSALEATYGSIASSDVEGLGASAFFANNKGLYFGTETGSGWITFQRAGEWTDEHRDALTGLAGQVVSATPDPSARIEAVSRCTPGCNRQANQPPRIWVGGDSLAAGPAWALGSLARDAGMEVFTEQQVGTGLARPDFFDWARHMESIVTYLDPDIVVFMAGTNDGQGLTGPGPTVPYADEAWDDEYRRRVGTMMDTMTTGRRKLVWIGEPPMRDPDIHERMERINGIVAAEAQAREAVTYLDMWTLLAPPAAPGVYTDRLVFTEGTRAVRLDDGLHLNIKGSQYVAEAVVENLRASGWFPPEAP